MLNERDKEHYEHEESEYHFSDDDVSYEAETDSSKPAAPEPEKKNPLAGLTQSKRMMISLVVFIGLVFVVYKMVSPGSQVPATEISPVAMQPAAPEMAPPPLPHTQTPTPVAAVAPVPAEIPAQPATPPAPVAVAPAAPLPATAAMAPVTPATPPVATTTTTTTVTPAAPAQAVATPPPPVPAAPQPVAQAVQPAAPAQAIPPAPLSTPVAAAPSPTAQPAAPQAQQPLPVATTVVTSPSVTPANTDSAIAAMAATNEKLINSLQAEYSQKVTDMGNQARAMQEQMQTLNSRVAGLETQLGQLVQTLTRQSGMGGTTSLNVAPVQQPPPPPMVEQKVNYNVQAIIPGRAWLKSDNGETLTVAEGDPIKDLGRVTKIDPYDGVVEVNTGSKTVSISYGSGG